MGPTRSPQLDDPHILRTASRRNRSAADDSHPANRGTAAGAHRFYTDQHGTPQYGATAFRGAFSELIRSNRALRRPASVPRTHSGQDSARRRFDNFATVHGRCDRHCWQFRRLKSRPAYFNRWNASCHADARPSPCDSYLADLLHAPGKFDPPRGACIPDHGQNGAHPGPGCFGGSDQQDGSD